MPELQFRRIQAEDKPWIDKCLRRSQFRGCEYTFGNNFVWRNVFNTEIASAEGFYFVRFGTGDSLKFTCPAGGDDIKRGVELLRGYCADSGTPLKIYANKQCMERICGLYPEASAQYNRDSSDYIYLADDLENLTGKKYHGKRNHLNRFYENDWSFESLTSSNMEECIAMNDRWCDENLCECDAQEEKSKQDESCIVKCSFKHFGELGYTGGVLRVNGEVQAFTFGEQSADDTFVVHVEKALRTYQGAYTAINREFVKSLGGKYKYINREDDTGAENLRKAKLSYYPVFMEEKYDITFGGNL